MDETIVILEASEYNPVALQVFRSIGTVTSCSGDPVELQNKDRVTVLVCRLGYNLDAEFLRMFPQVRYIVSPTTGLNHIDHKYCAENKICIISLKGEAEFLNTIRSTSEYTFSLLLGLVRNVVPSVKSVNKKKWNRDEFKGRELNSLTIGVIGVGRIGRHIISYAKAFGMSILACDPYIDQKSMIEKDAKLCSKEELFAGADIVTVHVDYRPENKKMITRRDFERMKPGSYFINTSRGELVSEDDIVWAMEEGILAGVALDVLSNEQDVQGIFNKNIIKYAEQNDNLIITPHIGGCTSDAMHNTELFVAEKLKHIIEELQD